MDHERGAEMFRLIEEAHTAWLAGYEDAAWLLRMFAIAVAAEIENFNFYKDPTEGNF